MEPSGWPLVAEEPTRKTRATLFATGEEGREGGNVIARCATPSAIAHSPSFTGSLPCAGSLPVSTSSPALSDSGE